MGPIERRGDTSGQRFSPGGRRAGQPRCAQRRGFRLGGAVAAGLAAAALLAGCAPSRPPLPVVPPADLPAPWVDALSAEPCPPPFWARLRIRVEAPGRPAVTLEGTLQAIAPDSLRLAARFGAWRPAFVLLARADSAELLVHETSRYWVAGRRSPDWAILDPAAWSAALTWLICPGEFFRGFRPVDAGRIEADRWTVEGTPAGVAWRATATLDRRTRSLLSLDLRDGTIELARVRASGHEMAAGAWLPRRMEVSSPTEELRVRIERVGGGRLSPLDAPSFDLLRPPGWTRHQPSRLDGSLRWPESAGPASILGVDPPGRL